jgi:hypothetical protein
MALHTLAHEESNIPPWCRHRVGTVKSFLNIDICRCLDAKTSCQIHEVSYSSINNCYRRHNYCEKISPGGRTIVMAVPARERKALLPSSS